MDDLDRLEQELKRCAALDRLERRKFNRKLAALIALQDEGERAFNERAAEFSAAQNRTSELIRELRQNQNKPFEK